MNVHLLFGDHGENFLLFLFVVYLFLFSKYIKKKKSSQKKKKLQHFVIREGKETFPVIINNLYIHFILIAGVPHVYVFLLNRRHVNPLSEDVHDIIITFSS